MAPPPVQPRSLFRERRILIGVKDTEEEEEEEEEKRRRRIQREMEGMRDKRK